MFRISSKNIKFEGMKTKTQITNSLFLIRSWVFTPIFCIFYFEIFEKNNMIFEKLFFFKNLKIKNCKKFYIKIYCFFYFEIFEKIWFSKIYFFPKISKQKIAKILSPLQKFCIFAWFHTFRRPGKASLIMSENLLKLKFEQSKYRHWSGGIHRGRLDNVMKI